MRRSKEETNALRKRMMDTSLQFRDALSRKDRDLDERAVEYAAAVKRYRRAVSAYFNRKTDLNPPPRFSSRNR
jgi:hypothetical protein